MSARPHRTGDLAAVCLAGILAAPLAVVWVATAAATLLTSRTPTLLSAGQTLRVAVRLPRRFADPRLAWPGALRAKLPSPALLDAALAVA